MDAIRNRTFFNIPASEGLFYIAFACFFARQGLIWTMLETVLFLEVDVIKNVLFALFSITLFGSLVLQKRTFKEYIIGLVLGSLILVSAFVCNERALLYAFLFVFAGQGVSFKQLAKITLVISCLLIFITLLYALSGTIEIRYAIVTDARSGRSAWGFTHPNRFAFVIFLVCLCWTVIRYPRINVRDYLLFVPSFFVILFVLQSRTFVLALCLLLIVFYGYNYCRKRSKARQIGYTILFSGLIVMGLSLVLMVWYDPSNPIERFLNSLVSNRFSLANEYFRNYPPSLFGTNFDDIPARSAGFKTNLVVDNSYARLVILYGIVPTLIWVGSFILLCVKHIRANTTCLAFALYGLMILLGFTEYMTLDFASNFALISLAYLWDSQEKRSDESFRNEIAND